MAVSLSNEITEAATQAFLRMAWREHEKRNPGTPNPVLPWEDMRPRDRDSFKRCVAAALSAAENAVNSAV